MTNHANEPTNTIERLKEAGEKAQTDVAQISILKDGFYVHCGRESFFSQRIVTFEAVEIAHFNPLCQAIDAVVKDCETSLANFNATGKI